MDRERAVEIASSPTMANVTFNGNRVYIEEVNETNAFVHYLNEPENREKVPLGNLVEH